MIRSDLSVSLDHGPVTGSLIGQSHVIKGVVGRLCIVTAYHDVMDAGFLEWRSVACIVIGRH